MTGASTGSEKGRYRRASVREQLAEMWSDFLGNRRLQLALAAILLVLVTLRILTPESVGLAGVAAGECLYIRTSSSHALVSDQPVGTLAEVRATLRSQGAERAPCDLSHSHEVAAAGRLPDATGSTYPGEDALIERETPACEAAVAAYVGRDLADSRYAAVVVIPDNERWRKGERASACLVQRADGRFMDHRAQGSGE